MTEMELLKTQTFSEGYEIDCPHCGTTICFDDWLTDGWSGGVEACEECGKNIDFCVEYTVDVTATTAPDDPHVLRRRGMEGIHYPWASGPDTFVSAVRFAKIFPSREAAASYAYRTCRRTAVSPGKKGEGL